MVMPNANLFQNKTQINPKIPEQETRSLDLDDRRRTTIDDTRARTLLLQHLQ